MEKVKVLYFVDRMLRGGIQSLVIDWVSRFDKNKIQVDFLLLDDGNKYELEDTLKDLGCNVFKLEGIWINTVSDYIKYHKKANEFFKEHNDYKVVHLHSSSKNYPILKYAKKYNIPIRIAHSHNVDFQTTSRFKKIIGNCFKPLLLKYSTDYFACSILAGEWLFGKKIIKSNKFEVIHNAVDYDKFKFNSHIRKSIRKTLNISDSTVVIGNVARFEKQKNHTFLIDIFYQYQKKIADSKLLLIGTGTLENEIKEKVKNLNIEDKVVFLGYKNNVNEYMQAMDYFLFPSLFEGLGLVLIEAQANGIPCFTSDKVVPAEVKTSDCLKFIGLENNAEEWSNKIIKTSSKRKNTYIEIKEHFYLIEDVVKKLQKKYVNGEDI